MACGGGSPERGGTAATGHCRLKRGHGRVRRVVANTMRGTGAVAAGRRERCARHGGRAEAAGLRRARVGPRERGRGWGWVPGLPHLAANLMAVSFLAGTQRALRLTVAWSSVAQQWRRRGSARAREMAAAPRV